MPHPWAALWEQMPLGGDLQPVKCPSKAREGDEQTLNRQNHNILTIKHLFVCFFNIMLLCICLLIDHMQMKLKCGKNISNSDTRLMACVPVFLFLPHFDFICDLLLNRCTATWNLFVKWNPHCRSWRSSPGELFPTSETEGILQVSLWVMFLLKCK